MKSHAFIFSFFLIAAGAAARLLPHPPNVAPIAAMAIFAGIYLQPRWSVLIPLVALFLSDILLGWYSLPMMISVYASFLLSFAIGRVIRRTKNLTSLVLGVTVNAVLFFAITNWAVWAFGTMYPHTLSGLAESYIMALPFFRNSLLGDFFFTAILVGAMEGMLWSAKRLAAEKQAV